MQDDNSPPEHRKTVGVYDRPASADRPKTRTLALAVIAIIVIVAVIYFVRAG
jgi:hypothetical protein